MLIIILSPTFLYLLSSVWEKKEFKHGENEGNEGLGKQRNGHNHFIPNLPLLAFLCVKK